MFYWALVFLVVSLIAAIFGFGGIAADAAWFAKIVFIVALVIAAISFVMSRGRTTTV